MARLARVVVPGLPHHVTQRGNHRDQVFFSDDDYRAYLGLIAAAARASGTEVWAYCLMPNHVHFIMTPSHEDGLRATFAEAHRRYSARIHTRLGQTGHLWQGRFSSTCMDERHLLAAARYVPTNPVRSRFVDRAQEWPWSSARAHLAGEDDGIVTVRPILDRVGDFAGLLEAAEDEAAVMAIRRSRTTGRPVGDADWVRSLEQSLGRTLAAGKRGPKPRRRESQAADPITDSVTVSPDSTGRQYGEAAETITYSVNVVPMAGLLHEIPPEPAEAAAEGSAASPEQPAPTAQAPIRSTLIWRRSGVGFLKGGRLALRETEAP